MMRSFAVTKAIETLNQAEAKFGFSRSLDQQFFFEWQEPLPELTEAETNALDRLQQRYLYYQASGSISEGTVQVTAVAPLLDLAGLCDPPFLIRTKESVSIQVEAEDAILEGRIDILVLQNQFWVLVVEEKRGSFNSSVALPQALAYISANPDVNRSTFALVTNGEDYQFVKFKSQQYAFSKKFTLMSPDNELYSVLRILKRIGGAIDS
ncbi:MAG: type I restriction endonuclease subunit R [Leptolyngbyaceae cyanobacterium SM1_3_5]|nr:type I restriction endonuclease subunit R [Leptolyngbyaceae cyanobacterium SM1_3_5]